MYKIRVLEGIHSIIFQILSTHYELATERGTKDAKMTKI